MGDWPVCGCGNGPDGAIEALWEVYAGLMRMPPPPKGTEAVQRGMEMGVTMSIGALVLSGSQRRTAGASELLDAGAAVLRACAEARGIPVVERSE